MPLRWCARVLTAYANVNGVRSPDGRTLVSVSYDQAFASGRSQVGSPVV